MASSDDRRGAGTKLKAAERTEPALSAEMRYEVGPEIGKGATSTVYRAIDKISVVRRDVALKILNEEIPTEWDVLASVSHPVIVKLYGHGRIVHPPGSTTRPYVAMELLDGVPLKAEIQHGFDWKTAKYIIQECCRALAAAHDKSVLHCDIKPSNVFVKMLLNGEVSSVTVLDFGLAAKVRDHQGVTPEGGTYAYMSPEQIRREKVTEASDVFSLGVLAYELLTRQHPFTSNVEHARHEDLKAAITATIPEPITDINPTVPEHIALVVHRMLSKDPGERPTAISLVRLLDELEVFGRERQDCEAILKQARVALGEQQYRSASDDLYALERRGLAFTEITTLRREIDAGQADVEVTTWIGKARDALEHGQGEEGERTGVMRLAQAIDALQCACGVKGRRFDVRILQLEAELDYRRAQQRQLDILLRGAQSSLASGWRRRAEFLLHRLTNLTDCSPYAVVQHWDPSAADHLSRQIENSYSLEPAGISGTDAVAEDAADWMDSIPSLKVVRLEQLVGEHEEVLEKALALVRAFRTGGAAADLTQLEEHGDYTDVISKIVALYKKRQEIVDALREQLSDNENREGLSSDLHSLDALSSLESIAPTPDLAAKLHARDERITKQITLNKLRCILDNVAFLSQVGEWKVAAGIVQDEIATSPHFDELLRAQATIDHQLTDVSARDCEVARYLEHLARWQLEEAMIALKTALKLDPDNKVFALSLASLFLEKAKRLERIPKTKTEGIELASAAKALLAQCKTGGLLRKAVSELTGEPLADAVIDIDDDLIPILEQPQSKHSYPDDQRVVSQETRPLGPITTVDPPIPPKFSGGSEIPAVEQPLTAASDRRKSQIWGGLHKLLSSGWLISILAASAILLLLLMVQQILVRPTSGSRTPAPLSRPAPPIPESPKPAPDPLAPERAELQEIQAKLDAATKESDTDKKNALYNDAERQIAELKSKDVSNWPPEMSSALQLAAQTIASRQTAPSPAVASPPAPPPAVNEETRQKDLADAETAEEQGAYAQALRLVAPYRADAAARSLRKEILTAVKTELDLGTLSSDEARALLPLGRLIDRETRGRLAEFVQKPAAAQQKPAAAQR